MRTRPLVLILLVLLVFVPLSAAAAPPPDTLVIGLHVILATRWLDPGETEALITPFMMLYAIHDALTKPMPGKLITPSLAESWSVSKDGLSYDFMIRKGAKFHNGDPVTAEDVKFTFERYKGASAPLLKDRVKEIQILAPNHVRFVLKQQWPDFMAFYGMYWLDFLDQWDPKSPWHDKRVRLAASLAIDRNAINQAEMLGLGKATGAFVPPEFDFALKVEAPRYDPKRAKQLLAEAGYANGFDAGDLTPLPPYTSLAEEVGNFLGEVGIRASMRN